MATQAEIERKIVVLSSSVETLTIQINKLGKHVSALQLTMWRKYRASLNKKLKAATSTLKSVTKTQPRSL